MSVLSFRTPAFLLCTNCRVPFSPLFWHFPGWLAPRCGARFHYEESVIVEVSAPHKTAIFGKTFIRYCFSPATTYLLSLVSTWSRPPRHGTPFHAPFSTTNLFAFPSLVRLQSVSQDLSKVCKAVKGENSNAFAVRYENDLVTKPIDRGCHWWEIYHHSIPHDRVTSHHTLQVLVTSGGATENGTGLCELSSFAGEVWLGPRVETDRVYGCEMQSNACCLTSNLLKSTDTLPVSV